MTDTASPAQRHLLVVWDPTRAADPMEAHLRMLLDLAQRHRAGAIEEEEVYVWWGKIRSPHRLQPLPHLGDILAIDRELQGEDGPSREAQLYLTDYRSLYVAHIGEITADDVREDDAAHVPAMYDGVACDCWFRLFDIRRMVSDDTPAVVAELRRLRNVRYHDSRVSIYGGMVELPLIVTRDDGARWFEPRVRERLIEGRFWVESDAERAGVGAMERELRDNVVGEQAWSALDPAARAFVATAEKLFRELRHDAGADLSPVVVNLAKALEVQCNALVRRALAGAPRAARLAKVDGRTLDVVEEGPLALGELAGAMADERALSDALRSRLVHGQWIVTSLPPILREVARLRNPAAHEALMRREDVTRVRNHILGVGCSGVLEELGRVRGR